jgi:hypothetical protein
VVVPRAASTAVQQSAVNPTYLRLMTAAPRSLIQVTCCGDQLDSCPEAGTARVRDRSPKAETLLSGSVAKRRDISTRSHAKRGARGPARAARDAPLLVPKRTPPVTRTSLSTRALWCRKFL